MVDGKRTGKRHKLWRSLLNLSGGTTKHHYLSAVDPRVAPSGLTPVYPGANQLAASVFVGSFSFPGHLVLFHNDPVPLSLLIAMREYQPAQSILDRGSGRLSCSETGNLGII